MKNALWHDTSQRMNAVAVLLFLSSIPWTSWGQVGKIYIRGTSREVITGKIDHFEFNPFDTTLTQASFEYLNKFAAFYNDNLSRNYSYIFVLDPESTGEEKKTNKGLSYERLLVILHYLQKNLKIDGSKFRARYRETITTSCEAYIGPSKRSTKKQRNSG